MNTRQEPRQKSLRKPAAVLAALLLVLFQATVAFAATAPAPPTTTPLRLGITPEDYAPYFMHTPGATTKNSPRKSMLAGIMPDALRSIAARLDRRVEIRHLPRARLEQALLDGTVDTIILAREWTSTPEKFLFSDTLVEVRDVVIVAAGSPAQKLEDIFGRRVGARLGYSYPGLARYFSERKLQRQDADAEQAILQMLLLGRTDAAVVNEKVVDWLLQRQHLQGKVRSIHSLQAVGYRFVLSPRQASLLPRFNREIGELRRDGSLDRILATYRD